MATKNRKFKLNLEFFAKGAENLIGKLNQINKGIKSTSIAGAGLAKSLENALGAKGFKGLDVSRIQKLQKTLSSIKVSSASVASFEALTKSVEKFSQKLEDAKLKTNAIMKAMSGTKGELRVGKELAGGDPAAALRAAYEFKVPISRKSFSAYMGQGVVDEKMKKKFQTAGLFQEGAKPLTKMLALYNEIEAVAEELRKEQELTNAKLEEAEESVKKQANSWENIWARAKTATAGGIAGKSPLGGDAGGAGIGGIGNALSGIVGEGGAAAAALTKVNVVLGALSLVGGAAFKALKMIGGALVGVAKMWGNQFKAVLTSINEFRRGLSVSVDGMRQFTQGLLSVARAMTFFVAVPMVAFLKTGIKNALDFEKAIARVRKVTGTMIVGLEGMREFREEFGKLAAVSASSIDDFAMFAEQFGQMGVASKENMLELVALADVVAGVTDIVSESVATSMGSISNAFGYALSGTQEKTEEAINFLTHLANTVNSLENTFGTSAGHIIESLKDTGSAFSMLVREFVEGEDKMAPEAVIIAWTAIAQEFGMTAAETGTAMKNLPAYLARYASKITEIPVLNAKWATSQAFLNDLNRDFYNTIDEMTTALAENESGIENLVAVQEMAGRRSGRFLTQLVASKRTLLELDGGYNRYNKAMDIAKDAWEAGTSILEEYNIMLETAGMGLDMMKHGVTNLGLSLSDDVLPPLNKFARLASQALVAATDIMKGFSKATKLAVGKVLMFGALYGPVSWFLSQIAFGLSMATEGVLKFGAFVKPLIKLIMSLVRGVFTLNPLVMGFFAILHKATGGLGSAITDTVKRIDGIIKTLTGQMKEGGEAVMEAFAEGIAGASQLVLHSVGAIAEILKSFLMGHSPPQQGPLSDIDMWGAPVMNAWLKGLQEADFGILSDIASRAEEILTAFHFSPGGEGDRKKVLKDLINFREQFTKLLKDYRDGIKITDTYLDNLLKGMGDGADEVKKLIKMQLEHAHVQKRLADIEEKRRDINEKYTDQIEGIRLGTGSAEEMVEQIASAQYMRDQGLSALSKEEQLLERREKLLEDQLSIQEQMLDALNEQSSLWQELLSIDAGAAGGELVESLEGISGGLDGISEVNRALTDAKMRFLDLQMGANRFKVALITMGVLARRVWDVLRGRISIEEAFNLDKIKREVMSALEPGKEMDKVAASYFDAFDVDKNSEKSKIFAALDNSDLMEKLIKNGQLFGTQEEIKEAIIRYFTGEDGSIPEGIVEAIEEQFAQAEPLDISSLAGMLPEGGEQLEQYLGMFDKEDLSGVETFVSGIVPLFEDLAGGLTSIFGVVDEGAIARLTALWDAFASGVSLETAWTPADDSAALMMANSVGLLIGAIGANGASILDSLGQISEDAIGVLATLLNLKVGDKSGPEMIQQIADGLAAFAEGGDIIPIMAKMRDIFVLLAKAVIGTAIGFASIAKIFAPKETKQDLTEAIEGMTGLLEGLDTFAFELTPGVKIVGIDVLDMDPLNKAIFTSGLETEFAKLLGDDAEKFDISFGAGQLMIVAKPGVDVIDAQDILQKAMAQLEQEAIKFGGTAEGNTALWQALGVDTPTSFAVEITAGNIDATIADLASRMDTGDTLNITVVDDVATAQRVNARLNEIAKDRTMTIYVDYVETGKGKPPGKQAGGRVTAGNTYRINETGPEFFTPDASGKMTSYSLSQKMAHDLAAGSGGGTVININIDSPVVSSLDDIDQLVETISYKLAEMIQ